MKPSPRLGLNLAWGPQDAASNIVVFSLPPTDSLQERWEWFSVCIRLSQDKIVTGSFFKI